MIPPPPKQSPPKQSPLDKLKQRESVTIKWKTDSRATSEVKILDSAAMLGDHWVLLSPVKDSLPSAPYWVRCSEIEEIVMT